MQFAIILFLNIFQVAIGNITFDDVSNLETIILAESIQIENSSHVKKGANSQFSNESYMWNLELDPTESDNIYDLDDYTDMRDLMLERLNFWKDKLVIDELEIASDDDAWQGAYDICGGICPYIEDTFSLEIEQKYYSEQSPPHIVFVLVDDWGWNDIGFRSTYLDWATPTIDKLAMEGIVLANYFTHSFCVPTRAALLTGRFAGRLGLLDDLNSKLDGLPLSEVTLAQELKSAGYRTHMVGKWDLGDSSPARLPTYRGFDSFYGFYFGFIDYYEKTTGGYLDLHDGVELVTNADEISNSFHSAFLFEQKAEEAIAAHAADYPSTPMFLYYSMQLVHAPYEVPSEYENRCSKSIKVSTDEKYCGMIVMLDEAIANLTCTLEAHNMLDNTVFILTSDNGGIDTFTGDSVPFRGHKFDFNRGGVSATAFVTSKLIPESRRGSTYSGQMHVTDWLPTIMSLATDGAWTGGYNGAEIDGVDMWDAIVNDEESPRQEIVHYVNADGHGSIQMDMIKLDVNITPAEFDDVTEFFKEDLEPQNARRMCEDPTLLAASPTSKPTTASPSHHPTDEPTAKPTHKPSNQPTDEPSHKPSHKPTHLPTDEPSHKPTHKPTHQPTEVPTELPTEGPTIKPTIKPSTNKPTIKPTNNPSMDATTYSVTDEPSVAPTDGLDWTVTDADVIVDAPEIDKTSSTMYHIRSELIFVLFISGACLTCLLLLNFSPPEETTFLLGKAEEEEQAGGKDSLVSLVEEYLGENR